MSVERSLIEAVLRARQEAEAASAKVRAAREVFQVQNQGLIDQSVVADGAVVEAEETVRRAALRDYAITKNKQSGPGLVIRVVPTLVYEPEKALAWAKDRRMALTLDVKAFKKLAEARADGTEEFVRITEVPQATIATDLAAALAKEQVEA